MCTILHNLVYQQWVESAVIFSLLRHLRSFRDNFWDTSCIATVTTMYSIVIPLAQLVFSYQCWIDIVRSKQRLSVLNKLFKDIIYKCSAVFTVELNLWTCIIKTVKSIVKPRCKSSLCNQGRSIPKTDLIEKQLRLSLVKTS